MKTILYIAAILIVLAGIALIGLSISSRKQPQLGLENGQLRQCPTTPNCLCSEYQNEPSYIQPLTYSIAHANAWQGIKETVIAVGGKIIHEDEHYLHIEFVTSFIRFVDDVELRLDEQNNLIHIRSASRVGHSDLGTNRKRVEKIRDVFDRAY